MVCRYTGCVPVDGYTFGNISVFSCVYTLKDDNWSTHTKAHTLKNKIQLNAHMEIQMNTYSVMQKHTCTQGNHVIPITDLIWQCTFMIAALNAELYRSSRDRPTV